MKPADFQLGLLDFFAILLPLLAPFPLPGRCPLLPLLQELAQRFPAPPVAAGRFTGSGGPLLRRAGRRLVLLSAVLLLALLQPLPQARGLT